MPDSVNSSNKKTWSDYSVRCCWDFGLKSPTVHWRLDPSVSITFQGYCWCVLEKSYHVGVRAKCWLQFFPRRGIHGQCERIWLRTKIYFHDSSIHYNPLCPNEFSSSCHSLPLPGLNTRFYVIAVSTWLQCNPIMPSSGCTATLPSVGSAGWIVQQLGMWMYQFRLCFGWPLLWEYRGV